VTTIALPFWTTPPLTQNKLRRMHHMVEARAKAEALSLVRRAIRIARVKPMVGAVVILHWRMADRRRQDGDGAAPTLKVCLDALVQEGVLPDDSWVHVPHSGVTTHPPVKGRPGALWLSRS
jgi:crossover junction endodeoxyribonuclease RusA